jgi:hypothetical protein
MRSVDTVTRSDAADARGKAGGEDQDRDELHAKQGVTGAGDRHQAVSERMGSEEHTADVNPSGTDTSAGVRHHERHAA